MVSPADPLPKKANWPSGSPQNLPTPDQWQLVNIVLGMPQRNCQYHGICRIDLEDLEDSHCSQRLRACLQYEDGRLHVRFHKEHMPEATREKHFASGYFIVLNDFTLPDPLQTLFRASFTIRRGVYPLRETPDHYIVRF